MVRKKITFVFLAAFVFVWVRLADGQPKNVPRVGFLASSAGERLKSRIAAFQDGLHELGHVDGKNIVLEIRSAAGRFDRLPELAAELVRLKVDVIVAEGAPAAHAAKNATRAVPIVIGNAADPVGTGLVASLARPGGNITGLSDFNLGVVTKRLELLKEVVPAASRVAVLLNPGNPTNPLQLKEIQAAAPALGVSLFPLEARVAEDIDAAFAVIKKDRLQALIVLGDPLFGTHPKRIADLAIKARLPAIYGSKDNMGAGGLMSYGTNFDNLYRRAAVFVDKILKGAKPADLPVEQPSKFELIINLSVARQMGLNAPQSVLYRADEVIR